MYEKLLNWILNSPREARSVGLLLANIGAGWLFAGVLGQVVLFILNEAPPNTKIVSLPDLAHAYPTLPTWWVPESFLGSLPAYAFLVIGILLTLGVRKIERYAR